VLAHCEPKADAAEAEFNPGLLPYALLLTMSRRRLFRVIWTLLLPARLYVTRSPVGFGKNFLRDVLLRSLLPPSPSAFLAPLPFGRRIEVRYREGIGLSMLLEGQFEGAEIETLASYAHNDSTAIDVGANIGIYTVVLATAVGTAGRVLAFEPAPDNVDRLRRNLRLNGISNVDLLPLAVGARSERVALYLSDDPALHSTSEVAAQRRAGRSLTVAASSLDMVWNDVGRPAVSVVKIDVEGVELGVLQGARELLAACRPILLIEIKSARRLADIKGFLAPYDYRANQPEGFMRWNYLFVAEAAA
jgi:FkbM family methyltransferase